MALRTDKWLRKDPSDHRSSISLSGSSFGGSFRDDPVRGLGVHVGRCAFADFVVKDFERDSVPG